MEHLSPTVLYSAFVMSLVVETYMFMMQRSALEISRAANIDPKIGRNMLPTWYLLAWPAKLTKWATIVVIAFQGLWLVAVGFMLISLVLTTFVPIPHNHFLPMFNRTISSELSRTSYSADVVIAAGALRNLEAQIPEE